MRVLNKKLKKVKIITKNLKYFFWKTKREYIDRQDWKNPTAKRTSTEKEQKKRRARAKTRKRKNYNRLKTKTTAN